MSTASAHAAPLAKAPNVVTFHDRGVGRASRHLINGKVVLNRFDEELPPEVVQSVEAEIAKGTLSGYTDYAGHPEWLLRHVAA